MSSTSDPVLFRSWDGPTRGKSTLLNALGRAEGPIVAISRRPPAFKIQAVLTRPEAQIVFVDTPGIHKADSPSQAHDGRRFAPPWRSATCFSWWWTPPRPSAKRTGAP